MSTITSSNMSPSALAASLQARLLEQTDTGNGSQTSGTTSAPSLANTLMNEDASSGPSAQAANDIVSLMMDIQTLTMNAPSSRSDSAGIFSAMDANGDGQVTQAEFLAAKPDSMTSEQASALFSAMDAGGTGSISQQEFASGLKSTLAGAAGGTTASASAATDPAQMTQDLMRQLLQVIQNVNNNYVDTGSAEATASGQATA